MTSFEKLQSFILNEMRMSHIYQPVMLETLLSNNGYASVTDIAKALLAHDQAQIEYYEVRVNRMVGKVLTNNRGITRKEKQNYFLNTFEDLSESEVEQLIALCREKVIEFLDERDSDVFAHRRVGREPISGSVRYSVLSKAKYRCELCGVSASVRALEVDHIIPRSLGGANDESNYQALCYVCNSNKSNRDSEDLRRIVDSYEHRDAVCVFCNEAKGRLVEENELALAFMDGFPVTEGHTLIIPKRHVSDYFDLYQPELNAIHQLLQSRKSALQDADPSIKAFNVGVNAGREAGQTVFHCHIHLIPRREGDVEEPRGGVRGVIPSKQKY